MTRSPDDALAPVIILGMHRSGTSCLAGCLEEAGLYLGAVNKRAPYNARGNQENVEIMRLHEAVLTASGGAWDAPPDVVTWSGAHRAQQNAIIASYPTDRAWGFKDPRTLLTLDAWLEALPVARCVATFRHPLAVARSIEARDGFSEIKALSLWLHYNRRLLAYRDRLDVKLICFDWPLERYRRRLATIAAGLSLTTSRLRSSFLDPALRRQRGTDSEGLPDACEATYRRLEELSAAGEARTNPCGVSGTSDA